MNFGHETYKRALRNMQQSLLLDVDAERASKHSGEIGRKVEERVRAALKAVLPEKIGVSHGLVIDSLGGQSKQMDIVLYDRYNMPRVDAGIGMPDAQVFPVEGTYACGEIKTHLTIPGLHDSFAKCESYKCLVRRAYFDGVSQSRPPTRLFGKTLSESDHWESIFFCITVSSIDMVRLANEYNHVAQEHSLDISRLIDMVVRLSAGDRGNMLVHSGPGKRIRDTNEFISEVNLVPDASTELKAFRHDVPWSFFINLLLEYMTKTVSEPISMGYYLAGKP